MEMHMESFIAKRNEIAFTVIANVQLQGRLFNGQLEWLDFCFIVWLLNDFINE